MTRSPQLHLVTPEPTPAEAEAELARLFPELADLEKRAAQIRARIDEQRRRLATKRGVAFLRFEHVRAEFSGTPHVQPIDR